MTVNNRQKRILWIALFRGIGDAVLLYPAIRKSEDMFAGATVEVLFANALSADVFRAYRFTGPLHVQPAGHAARILQFLRMRPWSYDLVFDASSVDQNHTSRWLSRSLSRGAVVGYNYGSSSWLYTRRLDTAILGRAHMKDIYANLLSPFCSVAPVDLIAPPDTVLDSISALPLAAHRRRIVVHPGGRDNVDVFEKRWPAERYAELILGLLVQPDIQVVIVGSAGERAWIGSTLGNLLEPRVINVAGQTSIEQLFGLMLGATLFVGNNSGPLHVAHASGIPILTFAGGIPLYRWGIPENARAIVLGLDKRCPECTEYECPRHGRPCLEAISTDEALVAARTLLA